MPRSQPGGKKPQFILHVGKSKIVLPGQHTHTSLAQQLLKAKGKAWGISSVGDMREYLGLFQIQNTAAGQQMRIPQSSSLERQTKASREKKDFPIAAKPTPTASRGNGTEYFIAQLKSLVVPPGRAGRSLSRKEWATFTDEYYRAHESGRSFADFLEREMRVEVENVGSEIFLRPLGSTPIRKRARQQHQGAPYVSEMKGRTGIEFVRAGMEKLVRRGSGGLLLQVADDVLSARQRALIARAIVGGQSMATIAKNEKSSAAELESELEGAMMKLAGNPNIRRALRLF